MAFSIELTEREHSPYHSFNRSTDCTRGASCRSRMCYAALGDGMDPIAKTVALVGLRLGDNNCEIRNVLWLSLSSPSANGDRTEKYA